MELYGYLLKVYKGKLDTLTQSKLLPLYRPNLEDKDASDREILDAICFLCDVLEFSGEELFKQIYSTIAMKFGTMIPKYIDMEDDRNFMQSLSYGVGLIAQRTTQSEYAQFLEPTIKVSNLQ
jgi:hypothetical protein